MKLAIASGKGGTGKTTLAVSLAMSAEIPVRLLDCDVEAPNAHLFTGGTLEGSEIISIRVPEVDETLCDGCGECAKFCQYNAIAAFSQKTLIFPEMCHACGGCVMVCPLKAMHETDHRIGVLETIRSGLITLIQGRLDIGVAMAPPLIRALKKNMHGARLIILDAPPGTSCPVVSTLRGMDYILLVTEPTPFGLNDLALAVNMVRELRIPFGVIVNRMGIGDGRVHDYCAREEIPVLLDIPDDRAIAEAYSRGIAPARAFPEYRKIFKDLLDRVGNETEKYKVAP